MERESPGVVGEMRNDLWVELPREFSRMPGRRAVQLLQL